MSFLMVEQLQNNDLIQFNVELKETIILSNLRLWLYKKGTVNANLTLSIYNLSDELISQSILTPEKIALISGSYFHGYVNFEFAEKEITKQSIKVKIGLTDYTNSDSNYLALVRNVKPVVDTNNTGYVPISVPSKDLWVSPFGIEIYTY